jgi:hypothetical protein
MLKDNLATGHFLQNAIFRVQCHARMLLSGIHLTKFRRFPLKTCGNDSSFQHNIKSVR